MELDLLEAAKISFILLLKVSFPILLTGIIVGLIVAILQSLTQIQEITLTFVPKIFAMFFAVLLFLPFIASSFFDFFQIIIEMIVNV